MPGRPLHLLTLAIVLLAVAAPARAQERTPTPSARELWRDYPLAHERTAPRSSATPARARSATRTAAATDPADPHSIPLALLIPAALVAAGAGAVLAVRRRRSRSQAFTVPMATAPRLAFAGPPAGSDRLLFSRATRDRQQHAARSEPPQQPPGVRPPDPDRPWTAEIQWARSGDSARFCVVARDEQGHDEPVIARSEPFDWPPEGTDAVQALVGAADALGEALTLAGWKPLPAGEAWYAKRFEWEPAPVTDWVPPRPGPSVEPARPPTNRFQSAGEPPRGTDALWRCAITWRPGYARSRFEVVMHDPTGKAGDRVIAASQPFKWLLMSAPDENDATFRAAAVDLAAALESAGWERVSVGAAWYAAHFVWRGDEPPSAEILVAPARRSA